MSKCFFLSVSLWTEFFRQYIDPPTITIFSANPCYWIPPKLFINNVVLMNNLEELDLLDTQVSLNHLPRVFSNCLAEVPGLRYKSVENIF